MAIKFHLDMMMVKRKISLNELSEKVGVAASNLSLLKNGKVRGIRNSTLNALCTVLECQPADLFSFVPDEEAGNEPGEIQV